MLISMNWINDFVDLSGLDLEKLIHQFTLSTAEVEDIYYMGRDIKDVVVARIVSIENHPDSKKLHLLKVDAGDKVYDCVCGAPNVREGMLVAFAREGGSVSGMEITCAKIAGYESHGMCCSEKELGISADHSGLWEITDDLPLGTQITDAYGVKDVVFEVDNKSLTNRPDLWGHYGIAREFAALTNRELKPVSRMDLTPYASLPGIDIDIRDKELCYRYTGLKVRNITKKVSPVDMRIRLFYCGMRAINLLADLTNYLMLELGQPMHAFDYRYVKGGKIVVRRAGEDKTLTTLDGNVRNLKAGMLVIADENKPIGLAGIMGGENSEIKDDTAMVVFESANFDGTSIRQTALALGMRTEASGKFEKRLDPMMTVPAVQRACELVEMLGCGDVLNGTIDVINYVPEEKTLPLEPEKINRLLGTDISKEDMVKYLNRLEIPVEGDTILVPSFRPDLNLMADIAEEVGRSYGYNEIPTTAFKTSTQGGYSPVMKLEAKAGTLCRAMGYSEIITYSFVSPSSFDAIRLPADSPLRKTVKLVNPLGEDTSIMRTVILPSMLDILSRNYAFKNKGVKLYEIGKIYLPVEGQKLPDEPKRMIFGTYGEHENFFTLKGEIDALLEQLNVHPAAYIADTKNPSYHPGRCADIIIDGKKLGVIGQIHPLVAEGYGIDGEVYVAELDFTGLQAALAPERVFHSLPKFPTVSRDLALVCDEAMTVGMLEACIKKAGGKLLRSIQLFDIYRGPGIAPGKKSVAFSLELRADDRTLTDEDTTGVTNAVLEKLKNDLGVTLR